MTRNAAEKMARLGWQVPLVTLFLISIANSMVPPGWGTLLLSLIYLGLFIAGLVCGIRALLSVREHGKAKLLVPGLVGVLLNLAIPGIMITIAVPSYVAARGNIVEAKLNQIAEEMTRAAPTMVDNDTRLDSIRVSGPRSLDFNYTVIKFNKEQIDVNAAFKKSMTAALYDRYMTAPQMEWFRNQGIQINHVYNDKGGIEIATFAIKKDLQQ